MTDFNLDYADVLELNSIEITEVDGGEIPMSAEQSRDLGNSMSHSINTIGNFFQRIGEAAQRAYNNCAC